MGVGCGRGGVWEWAMGVEGGVWGVGCGGGAKDGNQRRLENPAPSRLGSDVLG